LLIAVWSDDFGATTNAIAILEGPFSGVRAVFSGLEPGSLRAIRTPRRSLKVPTLERLHVSPDSESHRAVSVTVLPTKREKQVSYVKHDIPRLH
jgi:hypothetical protein